MPEETALEQPQEQAPPVSGNNTTDQEPSTEQGTQGKELFSGTVSSGSVDFSKSGTQGEAE